MTQIPLSTLLAVAAAVGHDVVESAAAIAAAVAAANVVEPAVVVVVVAESAVLAELVAEPAGLAEIAAVEKPVAVVVAAVAVVVQSVRQAVVDQTCFYSRLRERERVEKQICLSTFRQMIMMKFSSKSL